MKTIPFNYSIYHIRKDLPQDELIQYLFSSMDFLEKFNLHVTPGNYNKVYEGIYEYDSESHPEISEPHMYVLEELFTMFNVNQPSDYHAHSMSVSDIIVLNGTTFFCDSFGFIRIDVLMENAVDTIKKGK